MTKKKSLKPKSGIPPIRLHRSSGQGYIRLDGRMIYLGRYGSDEAREKHQRVVREWKASGGKPPAGDDLTIRELLARFLEHAERYYANSNEPENYALAMTPVVGIYGATRASEFGPLALRAAREAMVERGWSRRYVNKQVVRVRGVFRWAAAEQLVSASVLEGLKALPPLKRGRCDARETAPVRPVPDLSIEAVLAVAPPTLAAMIQAQRYTACRPGEVCIVRAVDIDTTGPVWIYRPQDHKGAWRDREREIYIGPRCQQVLKPFMANRPVDAFLFSPREAEAQRHALCPTHRPEGRPRNPKKTDRIIGDRYTTDSYRRAIEYCCKAAGIDVWTPHRLRHSAGTMIRRQFGLEATQCVLGHARADVTQIYAETNKAAALRVIGEVG